jgi:hypothetical protein
MKTDDKNKNLVLRIRAAGLLDSSDRPSTWETGMDEQVISSTGFSYSLANTLCWKGEQGSAWVGKEMELQIECPEGFTGELQVMFRHWEDQGDKGSLDFEGRKYQLELTGEEGKWISFHVMREDTNDGKITLKALSNGQNFLIIPEIRLVKES